MPTQPHQVPWYADYHFRFESVRSNGARITHETAVRGLSEAETVQQLKDLLGPGRYTTAFLGITEVVMSEWPLISRLGCGLDPKGNPVVANLGRPIMTATVAGRPERAPPAK
jgi:hypothetical protein